MIDRLPLNIGFARVSQATEDQGNLETQARQLQEYGVHEVVTEVGSGARSDRQALRNLKDRLQAGDTLVVTAIDRISRRDVDGLRFIRDVTDAGIHLAVLSQREFDTPPHRPAPAAPHPGHRRVGVEQHPGQKHPGPAAGPGRGETDRPAAGAHPRGAPGGGAQAR